MTRALRIYNTLSRQVETFEPHEPGRVGLYCCGPTVYSYAHIGNMRSYIFADVLRRTLEYFGYTVKHVMNVTDVGHLTGDEDDTGEDKLEVGAKREGLTAWDIAKKYTDAFFEHANKLGIERPHVICRATDHIQEQIDMVKALEEKGYTYRTSDGIYFDTSKFEDYAHLGRLDVEGLRSGHRVDVGEKRNKTDFALWKFSKPDEKRAMEWDSPWGRGFPGWHIECSAMAVRYLGEQFDIHTGGVDHIPIHHTNEVAQSECATGKSPFVKYWMHGEFLVIDDAPKMSKSLGNVITVSTLEEKGIEPLAFRSLCLQTHYRKQLRFNYDNLVSAAKSDQRMVAAVKSLKARSDLDESGLRHLELSAKAKEHLSSFEDAIANDLNMPQAMANLWGVIDDQHLSPDQKLALVARFDGVLGLTLLAREERQEDIPPKLQQLLEERNRRRAEKNWAEADRLRDEIAAQGYEILDSSSGTTLKRKL